MVLYLAGPELSEIFTYKASDGATALLRRFVANTYQEMDTEF